ncbi:MAG: NAD(P)-dependent oxidoreductase [Phycisphaerae bacterium]
MKTVVITGASGFIGRALAQALAPQYEVVAISRKNPELERVAWVRGEFGSFEDLRALDKWRIDTVIHLAAVTGGCLERDGILVNVEGTRSLMRNLMDRGCRKFVLASSIATVGIQNKKFRPLQVPIPDEHPCLDRDGYGISKFLMEEVTKYYQRQMNELDVINLRLASIAPDEKMPVPARVFPLPEWGLGHITVMARSDAVRAFTLAAEAAYKPGVRIMNATGPQAWVADPVADILSSWWGKDVDLSPLRRPGHEYDSVYDVQRIKQELGFVAQRLPDRSAK